MVPRGRGRSRGGSRQSAGRCPLAATLAFLVLSSLSASATAGDRESSLEKAASLRAAGRFEEALETLRLESREIKQLEGEKSLRLLPVNDLAADILIDTGAIDTARPLLDKTIAARRQLVDAGRREQSAALGGSLLTLARLETSAQRLPAAADATRMALLAYDSATPPSAEGTSLAREAVRTAAAAIEQLLGPAADATRKARDDAAAVFASLGMFEDAIEQRARLLQGLLSADAPAPDDVLEACNRVGHLMLVAGRATEGIPLIERASGSFGPEQAPQRLAVRRLLGELQMAADRLVLADESFARVLEEAAATKQPSAASVSGDRLRRLLVALRRGSADRLPEWFGPTTQSLARSPPQDMPTAIRGLVVAGQVQEALDNPAAAAQLLGQAVTFAAAARAPDAGLVADISGRLAAAQLAAGEIAAARKTATAALPAAERLLGPGDARTSFLRVLLADALLRDGETEKAVALAGAALNRELPRPDEDWEELVTGIYDRLASVEGHSDLRERYLAGRRVQFGESHPHAAAACRFFGAARLAAGDWPAAVDFFTRSVEMQQARSGPEDPELAASLVLLAHAERAAGRPKQAAETAALALASWEKVAGMDHPGTLSAAEVLLAARGQAGETAGAVEILERLCAADSVKDPVRRAAHLVQLADAIAAENKPRAKELLREAMQLSCWDAQAALRPGEGRRLAFTAALAAHAFGAAGDANAATTALQRARELALQAENPKPLLDRIEALAARGQRPPAR
jgi:hypothetical protein